MKHFACVMVAVSGIWSCATTLVAQSSSGPLESTSQELKALQSKQSNQSVTKDSPSTSLPTLQITDPNAPTLEIPNPRKMGKDLSKQKDSKKNWLVDGVQQLEKIEKSKTDPNGKDPLIEANTQNKSGEQSGPQSLLEVYTAQQNQSDESKRDAKPAASARAANDPLAPFLQNWMGNSPVSGKFFDEFAGNTELPVSPASSGSQAVTSANIVVDSTRPTVAEGFDHGKSSNASNPYLTGLDSSSLRDLGRPAITTSNPAPISTGLNNFPVIASPETAPIDRSAGEKKTPVTGLSDDRKYFPQLKKF